jgi:hypothetical protein
MARHLQTVVPLFIVLGLVAGAYVLIATPRAAAVSITFARDEPTAKAEASFAHPRTATSMTSARPPVPLLLGKHEKYFAQDVQQATAPDGQAPKATPPEVATLKISDDATPSEGAAKAMIAGDGYKSVSALAKGQDGKWRGRAMRGVMEVAVSVDKSGNVSSE